MRAASHGARAKRAAELRRDKFSQNEDDLLREIMNHNVHRKWDTIESIFQERTTSGSRTARQLRERWYNYIDPGLELKWEHEDDRRLSDLVRQHGRDFALIGRIMGNRSGKGVQNRYRSLTRGNLPREVESPASANAADDAPMDSEILFNDSWILEGCEWEQ